MRRELDFSIGDRLGHLVNTIVESYQREPRLRHMNRAFLPSRAEIGQLIEYLLELIYPGIIGRQDLTNHNVSYHVGELLPRISHLAFRQIHKSLCYQLDEERSKDSDCACRRRAADTTVKFIERLVDVREMLAGDVQAAYDGDPAAFNSDEIILAYPGLLAVTVYRLAHELYDMEVPLMPRIMTEWAHGRTGVDLHPGAKIGRNFFIDHATGVVVGETTEIGDYVKVYQGVTLGALSFPKDERGRIIRGTKRHPTVEDYVTIYANAIILGGDTRIGHHAVIGGSVFMTSSVPPYCTVTIKPPELRVKERESAKSGRGSTQALYLPDYQI